MPSVKVLMICAFIVLLFSGCNETQESDVKTDALVDFAKANCLLWYFKSKDYDLSDIKKITSGIVEMRSYSADKFQKMALLVREYSPEISTKQGVDSQLAKCFILQKNEYFIKQLAEIRAL